MHICVLHCVLQQLTLLCSFNSEDNFQFRFDGPGLSFTMEMTGQTIGRGQLVLPQQ